MARRIRFEQEGGLYHVINRGNYRSWIFQDEGAKGSFEETVFEACGRGGWKLHAHCIMGNHYHLALETPEPNLSEGMRWPQSVFANRFNRFRKENGHIFQGRFKSPILESHERMGQLCHYIHINPVRARICTVEDLRTYRYSSYFYLWKKRRRPGFLDFTDCLESAGMFKDTGKSHGQYEQYLGWLGEDEPSQKAMEFNRMSKGWTVDSKAFKQDLMRDEKSLKASLKLGVNEAREMREMAWAVRLDCCFKALGKHQGQVNQELKSADWKVAIAAFMKKHYLCRNAWLAQHLAMGTESAVARYTSEFFRGKRQQVSQVYGRLNAKVLD